MSTFKKISRFLSSVLFYSILSILAVVVIMFLAYFIDQKIGAQKGEKRNPLFGAYIIISESMIPNINVYDAVVTVRVSQDKIKMNDIITFISQEIETAGTPITHRVIGIVDTGTGIKYRTKGDHNNTADFALIAPNEVIGKVYLRIPMIGYIQTFMTKPIGWLLIVVLPCLFIVTNDVLKLIRSSSKKEEQSEVIEEKLKNSNFYQSNVLDLNSSEETQSEENNDDL